MVFFCTCKHSLYKPTIASKLPGLKKINLLFKSSPETQQWNKNGVEGCLNLFIGILGEIITTLQLVLKYLCLAEICIPHSEIEGNPLRWWITWICDSSNLNAFFFLVCVCTCQLCLFLTLYNPRDYSLPGSSVHGSFQPRILVGCHFLLQGFFLTQGLNLCVLCLLHWQGDPLPHGKFFSLTYF